MRTLPGLLKIGYQRVNTAFKSCFLIQSFVGGSPITSWYKLGHQNGLIHYQTKGFNPIKEQSGLFASN